VASRGQVRAAIVGDASSFSTPRRPSVSGRSTVGVQNTTMTDRRLRVLFHPFFFLAEEWNGMDEHLLLLARHLDRRRFELLVLTHESDGPQTRILSERAGIRAVPAPYAPGAGMLTRLTRLRALYDAERVDLVHLHGPVAGGQLVAALSARLAGAPATVATYHQIQPIRLPMRSRAINYITHTALVDATIAVSRGVKASLIAEAGLPGRRIRVIHNGIDPPHDANGSARSTVLPATVGGEIRLGYFGRLSLEKGVDGLLEGLALLAPRCPSVCTLIVGDGPDRAGLKATAERLGIADRVRFLGFRPDARRIMEQVDVVVHVPVYEGFGLVALEAMAAGRPIVASDAPGGLSEIVVHGETGLIVPRASPAALSQALMDVIAGPAERARLGQNGRARYERQFTAQRMAARTAAVYEEALGGRRRA
jgi:glycosyltransferase involved in cell wall biosynthesis